MVRFRHADDGPAAAASAADEPRAIADWDESPRPARAGDFELRRLRTPDEFEACVTLQRQVWGEAFTSVGELAGFVNFARLGVVASEYRRDFYGETHSRLHEGIGTCSSYMLEREQER